MKDINYYGCHKKITFKVLLIEFKRGLFKYRYPLCCVLQYVWEEYNGLLPALTRWKKYALDKESFSSWSKYLNVFKYVPCDRCVEKCLKEK